VHERNLRPGRVDGRPRLRDVGQRLATEGSTEVAEENHQRRAVTRQRLERRQCGIGDGGHGGDLMIDLRIW
jgi:hypothetical protein